MRIKRSVNALKKRRKIFKLSKGYFGNKSKSYRIARQAVMKLSLIHILIHVDFMIGAKDMSIVGITKTGQRVQIFRDGNWAF